MKAGVGRRVQEGACVPVADSWCENHHNIVKCMFYS